MSDTKEIKIRLPADMVTDVDLYLQAGQVRVSRTKLLETLFAAFAEATISREPSVEAIADCIRSAVIVGSKQLNEMRFPHS